MKCLCCEKHIETINEDNFEPGCMIANASWLNIDPGFGSIYDHIGAAGWWAVICDNCVDLKKDLITKFNLETKSEWKMIAPTIRGYEYENT